MGIAFIETCVKSSARKGAWTKMPREDLSALNRRDRRRARLAFSRKAAADVLQNDVGRLQDVAELEISSAGCALCSTSRMVRPCCRLISTIFSKIVLTRMRGDAQGRFVKHEEFRAGSSRPGRWPAFAVRRPKACRRFVCAVPPGAEKWRRQNRGHARMCSLFFCRYAPISKFSRHGQVGKNHAAFRHMGNARGDNFVRRTIGQIPAFVKNFALAP